MKRLFLLFLLSLPVLGFSQQESRWGLIAGANEYYLKADFLSSKSGVGFTFGTVATVPVHEYSEILAELTFNRFSTELMGRQDALSSPEWIKFNADRINLAVLYDYNIIHFNDDEDFSLGVVGGPTLSFLSNYSVADEGKQDYLLSPFDTPTETLLLDDYSEQTLCNIYATLGITGRYLNWEASLRYNFGLTDPFRKLENETPGISTKGSNDYMGFQLTFFFGNYY